MIEVPWNRFASERFDRTVEFDESTRMKDEDKEHREDEEMMEDAKFNQDKYALELGNQIFKS